jgi:hypothetical protein
MVPAAQPSQQPVHVPHWRWLTDAVSLRVDAAPATGAIVCSGITAPQHFLNFLPLPQGQGSFLPGVIAELHHEGTSPAKRRIPRRRTPFGAAIGAFMPAKPRQC